MKKLFLYIFLGLILCNTGFAKCTQGDCDNGYGTYAYPSGDTYVGEYRDGKYHGQGTETWANEDTYVGEFRDSKYHGQGTFTIGGIVSRAGDKYVGEWKNDVPNGQGAWIYTDGTMKKGIWKDGELVEPN